MSPVARSGPRLHDPARDVLTGHVTDANLADLVDRWTEGWAASRGVSRERFGAAWRVEIGTDVRAVEYVVAAPSAGVLLDLSGGSEVWFTVVGSFGGPVRPIPRLTRTEVMMSTVLTRTPDADGEVHLDQDGDVAVATVVVDGVPAARGQAAVVGSDAVFDRISTEPAFQRRGLGRLVMAALTDWALSRGATTGLLVASPDGQHLYSALGWGAVAPVATYALG